MKKTIQIILLTICLIFLFNRESYSYVNFDIDGGEIKKIKILFNKVSYDKVVNSSQYNQYSGEISIQSSQRYNNENTIKKKVKTIENVVDVVEKNLDMTGLFSIEHYDGQHVVDEYTGTPDFQTYQVIGIDAFVTIDILSINALGELEIGITLWDILDERMSFAKAYSFSETNYRKVGHVIADQIYINLTGEERGIFNSKIAYIAESGNINKRKHKIITMDIDGENKQEITYNNKTMVTPLFSRDNKNELFFVAYQDKENLKTYKVNMLTKTIYKIADLYDMTFSPNYHPTLENRLIVSSTKNGVTNIYSLNLQDNSAEKITSSNAIDTTPSYSPDGQKIVFCSDRGGSQKLYIMDEDGKNIKQLTKGSGQYSKPSWSPDGRLIAFVKIYKGVFSIGVISPSGENERILMSAYLVEGVKWSPNGRYVIYSKKRGPYGAESIPYIYILDILTGYEKRLNTPLKEGATDPDWIGQVS